MQNHEGDNKEKRLIMNIGLIDVDGHSHFPNLALMKLSRYHKEHGDDVHWYTPFDDYDRVYMSKVFTFTEDFGWVIKNAKEIVKGGTGYDIEGCLPPEIDMLQPDYSIYPFIDKKTAYGFLTRGCIRKCKWCVVPIKEGHIHPYMDIDQIAIEGRNRIILMDNNLIASGDYGMEQLHKIIKRGYRIDLNQANDARLVDDEVAKVLAKVKWIDGTIRFGCDTPAQINECLKAVELISKYGFKGHVLLYTMLHGELEECLHRLSIWKTVKFPQIHFRCQAQPMLDLHSKVQHIPQWQKDMAEWANRGWTYKACDFKDFEPRVGFKCREYFT